MEQQEAQSKYAVLLLVESEVLVRAPIAAYLRDCGYKVIEAVDGKEAVAVVQRPELAAIDVAFIDADLSGELDGFALAQWLRQTRPEIHIVLSASPDRAADHAGKLCDAGPLLARPYDPQSVSQRIRQYLASRPRRD